MNDYTLLKFWAPWCAPCREMSPVIDAVSSEFNVKVVSVNVDEDTDSSIQYNIRSVPTVLLLRNGEVVERIIGRRSATQLRECLSNHS